MVIPPSSASDRIAMPPPRLKPEEAFNQVDVNHKGYVTEAELASAIVQLSPRGLSLSQADAESVAQEAFNKLDGDGDGKVTLSEFKAGAPNPPPHDGPPPGGGTRGPSGQEPRRPQGPPPGDGAGGRGVEPARSAETYDPADSNEDGTVSDAERVAYESKQPNAAASTLD